MDRQSHSPVVRIRILIGTTVMRIASTDSDTPCLQRVSVFVSYLSICQIFSLMSSTEVKTYREKEKNQNCLLVTRQNDCHSPGRIWAITGSGIKAMADPRKPSLIF